MDIDWFTIAAQIVNFLILVGLLTKLLYRPIVNAMQQREDEIADRIDGAEKQREQAQEKKAEYEDRLQQVQQQRDEMLAEARHDARQERERLIDQARAEVDDLEDKWRTTLQREQETFLTELRRRAGRELCRIARNAIADLANAELERRIVGVFTERLAQLPEDEAESVRNALREDESRVHLTTAFSMPPDLRQRVTGAVEQLVQTDVDIDFAQSQDVLCGIELRAGGRKIAWSVDSYLQQLEQRLLQQIEQQAEEPT